MLCHAEPPPPPFTLLRPSLTRARDPSGLRTPLLSICTNPQPKTEPEFTGLSRAGELAAGARHAVDPHHHEPSQTTGPTDQSQHASPTYSAWARKLATPGVLSR